MGLEGIFLGAHFMLENTMRFQFQNICIISYIPSYLHSTRVYRIQEKKGVNYFPILTHNMKIGH
jgi:hypothetical protein